MSNAKIHDLESDLKTIGYYKQRTKHFLSMSDQIVSEYDGKIPDNKSELMSIKHIGDYISGAILSLGYNKKSSMVDTNVERVYKKLFQKDIPVKSQKKFIDNIARVLVPDMHFDIFNLGLLDIGGTICTHRRTDCLICPLVGCCDFAAHVVISKL